MTKEDLLRMIAEGESQRLELKSRFNVEAMEAVAAFANAEGGKVVIGVNNKSKIVGVDINSESVQNWVNEIKSKTGQPLWSMPISLNWMEKPLSFYLFRNTPLNLLPFKVDISSVSRTPITNFRQWKLPI